MDQHPIPQDVTGFQFKLIGTMTVKQFGYVAGGVITAVILYYLPIHSALGILLKVLFVPLFGASGVIISFVPIDGRPIDLMATNFVKALFSPNQYVYHRQGRILSFDAITFAKVQPTKKTTQNTPAQTRIQFSSTQLDQKEEKLRALLIHSRGMGKNDIDKKEAAFLQSLTIPAVKQAPITPAPAFLQYSPSPSITMQKPILQAKPMQQVVPVAKTPEIKTNTPDELSKKETELEKALSQAKQEELTSNTPATHTVAEQKITLLSSQIQEVHAQKQKLEQELQQLQSQLASQKMPIAAPSPKPAIPTKFVQDPQHVRVIPKNTTKSAGLPHISDSPNVVVGIVKDPRGNIQPNILVEVKDKDGNPVRAFKTNQLGQFISATPLSPGNYTIELEDPKKLQRFDIIRIAANNQIMPPIEVISHDAREELRKQLFTN